MVYLQNHINTINGLPSLQQKILRKLCQEDLIVWSDDQGKALSKQRLRNKKVLVILDDVDNYDQFDALARNLNWFGKRSRIVIITRNIQVLPSNHVQHIYEVGLSNEDETKAFFRVHAFPRKDRNIETSQFPIDHFLVYAARLPLAHPKVKAHWEILTKISYDGLDEKEKAIFLDIACFFKGQDKTYVLKVLRSCSFEMEIGFKVLVEPCLITYKGYKFQMHDLIEAMGRNIVRDKCSKAGELPCS